jgi:hypothetical protein
MKPKMFKQIKCLLLISMLLPFLVGFSDPDSSGIHFGASIGKGRNSFTLSGCNRYTEYRNEFEDVNYRVHYNGENIHVGAFVYSTNNEKIVEIFDDDDGHSIDTRIYSSRYYGAFTGANLNPYKFSLGFITNENYKPLLPIIGLEYHFSQMVYITSEFNKSSPLISGGYPLASGIGLNFKNTNIWIGPTVDMTQNFETSLSLKIRQKIGIASLQIAGYNSFSSLYKNDYGISVGLSLNLMTLEQVKNLVGNAK